MDKIPLAKLFDLSGKTAIVTGGAMGIGLGIVERLAEAKANIVIADFDETAGQKTTTELTAKNYQVGFIKADV
ncbi:MAG: 2-deoxy-D-gluconate 3-dehydrogenase [Candidatus Berkelbacteria bacterium Licking1014_85]|uniref:2-deoxy-D-gluconate 3-dehydrogenase n=1 Tax=Candidatus Berkelbacteria bacterium Licking1014_85 TaxID=2017148 RepID=A0A554LJ80_9BACT|nr:MAG: 2-deoxy-D-gluconate 3-dehydrogenase [Candidatus Berkelbacteria bacterium Licking1014_85]